MLHQLSSLLRRLPPSTDPPDDALAASALSNEAENRDEITSPLLPYDLSSSPRATWGLATRREAIITAMPRYIRLVMVYSGCGRHDSTTGICSCCCLLLKVLHPNPRATRAGRGKSPQIRCGVPVQNTVGERGKWPFKNQAGLLFSCF